MNAPHSYVPDGPVETAPYLGYCQPETRQEAFAAVLAGVPMGAYDTQMINWLVGWDDPTCRTIASIMWRCRLTGPPVNRVADNLRNVLAAACQAARLANCPVCWAMPGDECVFTTAPDRSAVRGYHAGRFGRAHRRGLITPADLETVTAGLDPGAVIWDDASAPRQPAGDA